MTQWAELSLGVLYQIILPLFLVLGVGYALGRRLFPANRADSFAQQEAPDRRQVDQSVLRAFSKLVFYVLAPCLAFSSLVNSDIGGQEVGQIGVFILITTTVIGLFAWALARSLHLSAPQTSSLLLVAMFGNSGNYGLALNELAFGAKALDRAVVFLGLQAVLLFGLGVTIAARAHNNKPTQILSKIARVPILQALAVAGLVRLGSLAVPAPILKATQILGQAAIPVQLFVLGMQLSDLGDWKDWRLAGLVSSTRLLLAPLIALLLAGILGLDGLLEQVLVVEASTPSPIFAIILALEFDLAVELATGVVFITTVISPVVLVPLIVYLR